MKQPRWPAWVEKIAEAEGRAIAWNAWGLRDPKAADHEWERMKNA